MRKISDIIDDISEEVWKIRGTEDLSTNKLNLLLTELKEEMEVFLLLES